MKWKHYQLTILSYNPLAHQNCQHVLQSSLTDFGVDSRGDDMGHWVHGYIITFVKFIIIIPFDFYYYYYY